MFTLFFSLYYAMFVGEWQLFSRGIIRNIMVNNAKEIGTFLTSIFNNVSTPMTDFGTMLFGTTEYGGQSYTNYIGLIAFILALITSIGIVVFAAKGVKKAFGIFFMGIRR